MSIPLVPLVPGECDSELDEWRDWLVRWLDHTLPGLPEDRVRLPRRMSLNRSITSPRPWLETDPYGVRVIERRRAFAVAPYVGRPFAYAWDVGVADDGPQVAASEARVEYLPEHCVPAVRHHTVPHRRCILR